MTGNRFAIYILVTLLGGIAYGLSLVANLRVRVTGMVICFPMEPCIERDKLKSAAADALKDIINFTDRLLKAVGSQDPCGSLTPLDKDLENAVGTKERAFGALAQHCKEHGCDQITEQKMADGIAK